MRWRAARTGVVLVAGMAVAAGLTGWNAGGVSAAPPSGGGIKKIEHVVVIMQENRSFDSYFGTYPGAAGLPRKHGKFTGCVPDPAKGGCQRPYHDRADVNGGANHASAAAVAAIDGGKMDGFVKVAETANRGCANRVNPACRNSSRIDVMGYHDAREIPNYWRYARDFVLQDHMFEPVTSWSLPAHLYLVSAWSALCAGAAPESCANNIAGPYGPVEIEAAERLGRPRINFAWTDLTYLLHTHGVSWGYYVESGSEPDCRDDGATCPPRPLDARTPGIWNPLPLFNDVKDTGQTGNVQDVSAFSKAAVA